MTRKPTPDPTHPPPPTTQHRTIRLWCPHIHHTPITSKPHLHQILAYEYPALTHHPNYQKLLTDAERHLDIITYLHGKSHLKHGDIANLARTLGVTRTIIYRHVRQALTPRLYWLLDHAIAKTHAHHLLTAIHTTNTGIRSLTDLHSRLTTYYPTQYLTDARGQPDRLTQCEQYFEVLTRLAEGGYSYTDLATKAGKTVTNIKEWCTNKTRPGLLNLARRIPTTPPEPNHQWLPLQMRGRFYPTAFIHVPTTITNWTQIPPVLEQLQPLTNDAMTHWHHHFGPISQEDAFAYLLGNLVSDAGKITPHYTSTRLELNLSSKYTWSQKVGDAVCYYLGLLGINAEAKKPSPDKHRWRSQNTPLLTWIKHTCLGLTPQQLTTYTPITANWLLWSPKHIQIKFLQGLNDGDGYANTKYQKLGNACGVNSEFLVKFLDSLGVNSRILVNRVVIEQQDSIIYAAEFPFFLHATGRQKKAEKLANMIAIRKLTTWEPVHWKAEYYAKMLSKQGKSPGEITEFIFDKLNLCYYPDRIRKIIQKDESESF
jgi:hypothetical protein